MQKSAAIVTIGDELLSGKTKDLNTPFLIEELTRQGVNVRFCLMLPDESTLIGDTIKQYAPMVDWMFVCGGLGPTHDDITLESLASSFGVKLERNKNLEKLIKRKLGSKCTPEHLKMAFIPEGTQLLTPKNISIPIIQFQNIIVFPGVPELMQNLFNALKDRFQGQLKGETEILLNADEGRIAQDLKEVLDEFEGLKIGSYPTQLKEGYNLKLILQHDSKQIVAAAKAALKQRLGRFISR